MKYLNIFLTIIFLICLLSGLSSQSSISGVVQDASTGDPLIGVNLIIDGSSDGTTTDANGRYSITTSNSSATITASYIGYLGQSQTYSGSGDLDFFMSEDAAQLKTVIVTANKVEENLQAIPLAATVISGLELENRSAGGTLEALSTTPNVITDSYGASLISVSIRGLSTNFDGLGLEQAVGMYINDVYQPRGYGFNSTLMDIERIEVLRGPQGTLFGKNTIGGVVHVITEEPKMANSGSLELSAGNASYFRTRAKANLKLGDNAAFRISGALSKRNGVITKPTNTAVDDINNTDFIGLRAGLLLDVSDKVDVLIEANYSHDDATEQPVTYLSKPDPNDALGIPADNWQERETNINQPFTFERDQLGASAKITAEVGNNTLTSISAYTSSDDVSVQEVDATFLDMLYIERDQQFKAFSQEIRLNSSRDQDFSWVTGLYFGSETISGGDNAVFGADIVPVVGFLVGIPDLAFTNYGENIFIDNKMSGTSIAGYFSGTYNLSESLALTGGLRITSESKDLETFQVVNEHPEVVAAFGVGIPIALEFGVPFGSEGSPDTYDISNTALTGNLVLDAALSEDVSAYASFTRGFKGAGFNFAINPSPGAESIVFDPEFINNYELGFKSSFNNKIRFNAAAYYLTYNNKQEAVFEGTVLKVLSADKASGLGFEGELEAVLAPGFTVDASAGIQNLKYDDFTVGDGAGGTIDLADNVLFKSPNSSFHLGAQYSNDLSDNAKLLLRADVNNTGESFNDIFNTAEIKREAATLINLRAGMTINKKYSVSLWAKNLTDQVYFAHGFATFFGDFAGLNEGRTLGVDLKIRFF